MGQHDQRLKNLLKSFFREFFELFFAHFCRWVLDFAHVEWLDKEVFPDCLKANGASWTSWRSCRYWSLQAFLDERPADEMLAIVHVEVESGTSSVPIRFLAPRAISFT